MKVKFNALKGCFDLVDGPQTTITIVRPCGAGVNVGDIVHESLTTADIVETSVDNTSVAPSIGVVIAKPTTTSAEVLMYGEYDGASSLDLGKKVFLSTIGDFTSTPPTTDYVQNMGFAISVSKVFINPIYVRVKRA
jgi:hypothetical protein